MKRNDPVQGISPTRPIQLTATKSVAATQRMNTKGIAVVNFSTTHQKQLNTTSKSIAAPAGGSVGGSAGGPRRQAERISQLLTVLTRRRNGMFNIAAMAGAVLAILTLLATSAFFGSSQQTASGSASLASANCASAKCRYQHEHQQRYRKSNTNTRKTRATARAYKRSNGVRSTVPTTPPKPATSSGTPTTGAAAGATAGAGVGAANALPSGLKTVFQDDFNGTSVDETKWGIYEGRGNAGIGTRERSAVTVKNGELNITGNGWTAGGLSSDIAPTYGFYEIRGRVDKNTGYNTAVMLWPKSENWPIDGEINISEVFSGYSNIKSGSFVHWGANDSQLYHFENGDFTQWHTYAVDWKPDSLTYYLDGRVIWTVTKPEAIPHNPHAVAIQLDVSKDSNKTANTVFHIDWVRISQR